MNFSHHLIQKFARINCFNLRIRKIFLIYSNYIIRAHLFGTLILQTIFKICKGIVFYSVYYFCL